MTPYLDSPATLYADRTKNIISVSVQIENCHSHFETKIATMKLEVNFWIRFGEFSEEKAEKCVLGAWVCVDDLELAIKKTAETKNEFEALSKKYVRLPTW